MSETKVQGAQGNPIELARPVTSQKPLRTQMEERVTSITSAISNAMNGAISKGTSLVNRVTHLVQSHPFASLSLLAGMIGSVVGARYFLNNSPIIQPTGLVDIGSINPECIPKDLTCEKNLQPFLPSTESRLLIAYPKSLESYYISAALGSMQTPVVSMHNSIKGLAFKSDLPSEETLELPSSSTQSALLIPPEKSSPSAYVSAAFESMQTWVIGMYDSMKALAVNSDLSSKVTLQLPPPPPQTGQLISDPIESAPLPSTQPHVLINDTIPPGPPYKFSNEHLDCEKACELAKERIEKAKKEIALLMEAMNDGAEVPPSFEELEKALSLQEERSRSLVKVAAAAFFLIPIIEIIAELAANQLKQAGPLGNWNGVIDLGV